MDQAIADGVGQGWLADVVVPLAGWELTGDHGGPDAVAVLEDLEEGIRRELLKEGRSP